MKKLKFILPLALIALVVSISLNSCEQREDWRFPELGNGGFIKFVQQPFSWEGTDATDNGDGTNATIVKYHVGEEPTESPFNAFVEDPNGNIASVDFWVKGDFDGAPDDALPFGSTTTFPYDVSFTAEDMAALFNVDVSVFQTGDFFEFMTMITTVDGKVWVSRVTGCTECPTETGDPMGPGTWNGGTIEGIALLPGGDTGDNFLLPAVWYRVKYLAASE
jgi:hypothetical protein